MSDDYPVTRPRERPLEPQRPRREPAFPDDPEAARAEIEATRARMSNTIDEIEDVLLRKKEQVREKMDVLGPVREEPVKTIAMIFGAALALGFLTGNGKEEKHADRFRRMKVDLGSDEDDFDEDDLEEYEDEDEGEDDEAELAWERAETWEDRAHRLLRIAKAQEAELEIHRSQRDALSRELRSRRRFEEEEYEGDYDEPNVFDRIRAMAAERLAILASEVSQRMMRGS